MKPLPSASQLPLLARCRRSFREQQGHPNTSEEPARIGVAAHRLWLKPDSWNETEVDLTAHAYSIDPQDLYEAATLFDSAFRRIDELGLHCEYEVEVSPQLPRGWMMAKSHVDIIGMTQSDEPSIYVIDLKTGRVPVSPGELNFQVLAYAIGASQLYPWAEVLNVWVVQPRCGKSDPAPITKEYLEVAAETIAQILEEAESDRANYTVGEHCRYCNALKTCPAAKLEIGPLLAASFGAPSMDLSAMPDEGIYYLHERRKVADTLLRTLDDMIRREIRSRGALSLGNGKRFGYVPKTTEVLDTARGWSVAADMAGKFLPQAVDLKKSRLLDAIKRNERDRLGVDRLPNGKGAEIVGEFFQRQRAAGAISEETTEVLGELPQEAPND